MINYDYTLYGTIAHLNKEFNSEFQPGWNEGKFDTTLLIPCNNGNKISKVSGELMYRLYVWNHTGVREEIAAILLLPVHIQK